MPTVRAVYYAAALALVLVVSRASGAHAQPASDRTTFSDATGVVWGVAVLETSVALGVAVIAGGDVCETWGCGLLLAMVSGVGLIAGIVTGIATQLSGTPPDVAFALHETIWGGAGGFALGAAIAKARGGSGARTDVALAVGGALAFGGAAAAYSIVRRDALHRDPETTWATHLLAWGPLTLAAFSIYVFPELDSTAGLVAMAVAILATQGLATLAVELSASDAPAGAVAPLFSLSAPF